MENRLCWIRFQKAFGCGTTRGQKVLEHFGRPEAIFREDPEKLARLGVITQGERKNIATIASEEAARKVLDRCDSLGCRLLTPDDPGYPMRLRQIYNYPAALYVLGSLDGLDESLTIAMVGTRRSTDYGVRAASDIARGLAEKGVVIVSGMARGIDAASQTAAIKAGGRTIAVLGCGIDIVYPPENIQLEDAILRYGGAVVTEYPPGEQPLRHHFPIRNRIISGLSNGVVVVEGTRRSGSLITANHAYAQNRDVFAVPGSIYSPNSAGPNYLLSQHAKAVDCAESILEEYELLIQWKPRRGEKIISPKTPSSFEESEENGYNDERRLQREQRQGRSKTPEPPSMQQPQPVYLSRTQQKVYEVLTEGEAYAADYIAALSGLPTSEVLSALTQMELMGLVKTRSGQRFSR